MAYGSDGISDGDACEQLRKRLGMLALAILIAGARVNELESDTACYSVGPTVPLPKIEASRN